MNVLQVSGANAGVDFLSGSQVAIGTLELNTGLVGGADDLVVTNPVSWNGGGFQGSGRVQCNAGVVMNGVNRMDFQGRTLINLGTFTWNDGMLYTGYGSILSNAPAGTFLITDAAGGTLLTGTLPRGTIANAGLMVKEGTNSHVTYFEDFLINQGTLEVRGGWLRCWQPYTNTAGQTRLFAGSTFETRSTCQVVGGTLAGNGLVVGDVFNSGIVSPGFSTGELSIEGDYVQNSNGQLLIELGGTSTNLYDRLRVTGSAILAGTVKAAQTNNYMPLSNAVFTFLTGPRTGTFATFTHPTFLGMSLEYASSAASMRVTNIAPTPLLAAPTRIWHYITNDIEGNAIWRLYPKLTWPAMYGSEYYVLHTTNVASVNWDAWPDSGHPFYWPTYITATGATMTVEGPAIGLRIYNPMTHEWTETVEPQHFYHMKFKP